MKCKICHNEMLYNKESEFHEHYECISCKLICDKYVEILETYNWFKKNDKTK